jgi:hypothetical protein
MSRFTLELYFENDDHDLAGRASAALRQLVSELAPNVVLEILILKAQSITRRVFDWGGSRRDVPCHDPSRPGHQTLLITSEDIQAHGWGWPGGCVVSKHALITKAANGGNPADLLIHEWIHTLQGVEINGRPVPFTDCAEEMGFIGIPGADGEPTWHEWYRFALGG